METVYDTIIIGGGPAGLSAAINLKLHDVKFIWFGSEGQSEKIQKTESILNYPGFSRITGKELNRLFDIQRKSLEIDFIQKTVTSIMPDKDSFTVISGGDIYQGKTLLLSFGAVPPKGIPGEQELLGRGVSYCASCDGFLYKGKTIAVYCEGKNLEHEVKYLAELADRVYLFTLYKGCELNVPNITILDKPFIRVLDEEPLNKEAEKSSPQTKKADSGEVYGVMLSDKRVVKADGIFFLRNGISPSVLLPGLKLEGVNIWVDRLMRTNLKGCYAAGDCTGRPYQIAKAVGEGNIAAHSILEELANRGKR